MDSERRAKAYLILADGSVYEGMSIGFRGETVGETVFTTAMTGYMETVSDPSFYGQIIVHTFPMIGNYGAIEDDAESAKPALAGYVVRELCENGSNFRMESEFEQYLIKHRVVGICGLDTRELTRKIREHGVINAMITNDKKDLDVKLRKIRSFSVKDAVKNTSVDKVISSGRQGGKRVVLWDFGAKANIERQLIKRGCEVIKVPHSISAEEILKFSPDGIMLSNGGGDPLENSSIIKQIELLIPYKIPTFGICLGHQLLALAMGGKTKKLKYGHRGANQPVKHAPTGRVFITSQNHGYVVAHNSLPDFARISFFNANDKTCEGIEYVDYRAFSVQFHPEACGGPQDTCFLFDNFLDMMGEK